MFTGIIEEVGKVNGLKRKTDIGILEIFADKVIGEANPSDSISVNGVCLTLTKKKKNILTFDVIKETLQSTALRYLKTTDPVNLERPLRQGGRLGGHFVYGHIDGVRPIVALKMRKNEAYLDIGIERRDTAFIADKGSIAVDGISLTIGRIFHNRIRIFLIPYTVSNTNIFKRKTRDYVNIEFDMLTKFIAKKDKEKRLTKEFLKRSGF